MDWTKLITRLIMKLPDGVLNAMAREIPGVVGGRTLDARFRFIAAQAAKRPLPDPLTADFARAGTDMLTHLFGGRVEPEVAWADEAIETGGRSIPVRVYRPGNQNPAAPVMVFLHFGGGVVGNVGTCHAFCSIIAAVVGCPVVSVEYRLAPEHRFPAGLEDSLDAFLWVRDNSSRYGAPQGKAAVGGDSMGGHFTVIITQELKRRGLAQPFLQVPIYPATDLAASGGSMETYANSYPLTAQTMMWFMANYLPEDADWADPRLNPSGSEDLSGLAPAIIVTAGHDPLHDQGADYAKRLEAAGVSTLYRSFDTLAHGFTAYTGAIPAADAACRLIAADVARAYRAMGG